MCGLSTRFSASKASLYNNTENSHTKIKLSACVVKLRKKPKNF